MAGRAAELGGSWPATCGLAREAGGPGFVEDGFSFGFCAESCGLLVG